MTIRLWRLRQLGPYWLFCYISSFRRLCPSDSQVIKNAVLISRSRLAYRCWAGLRAGHRITTCRRTRAVWLEATHLKLWFLLFFLDTGRSPENQPRAYRIILPERPMLRNIEVNTQRQMSRIGAITKLHSRRAVGKSVIWRVSCAFGENSCCVRVACHCDDVVKNQNRMTTESNSIYGNKAVKRSLVITV